MDDLRCPMCGKQNPADAVVCQFCQARLTPLDISSSHHGEETEDWLRDLRGETSQDNRTTDPGNETQEASEEVPDWLQRIRSRSQMDQQASQAEEWKDLTRGPGTEPVEDISERLNSLSSSDEEQATEMRADGVPGQVNPGQEHKNENVTPEIPSGGDDRLSEPEPPLNNTDWLNQLESWVPGGKVGEESNKEVEPIEQIEQIEQSQPSSGPVLPDWLEGVEDLDFTSKEPASPGLIPDETPAQPVINQEEASSQLLSDGAVGGEQPSWLETLRGEQPVDNLTSPSYADNPAFQPESTEGTPSWLQDIATNQVVQASESPVTSPDEELAGEFLPIVGDEIPSWLNEFQTAQPVRGIFSGEGDPLEEMPVLPTEEIPPWLAELGVVQATETSLEPAQLLSTQQPAEVPAAPGDDMPSWLADLGGGQTGVPVIPPADLVAQPPVEVPAEPAKEIPSWLADLGGGQAVTPAAPPSDTLETQPQVEVPTVPGEELPSWLADLGTGQEELPAAFPETPSPAEAQLVPGEVASSWLAELQVQDSDEKPAEPVIPTSSQPQPGASPGGEEDIPNWMSSLQSWGTTGTGKEEPGIGEDKVESTETNQGSDSPGIEEQVAQGGDLPAWLADLQKGQMPISSAEQPQVDWLHDFQAEPKVIPPVENQQELPSWFDDLRSSNPEEPINDGSQENLAVSSEISPEPATSQESPLNPFTESIPAWLSELESEQAPLKQPGESEKPVGTLPPFPSSEDDSQDWLTNLRQEPLSSDQAPKKSVFLETPSSTKSSTPSSTSPFYEESYPNWLDDGANKNDSELKKETQEDKKGKAEELPGWGESMRPLRVTAAAVKLPGDEATVESSGPFAGIYGILSADGTPTKYRKPPAYSVKLQVSERQRVHAALLEGMISDETNPRPISQARSGVSEWLLRFVLGLILIIALAYPLITFQPTANAPILEIPTANRNFYSQVEGLPAGAPVLLAVDYQTAYASEMRYSALGLLEHLVERQARLTLISTLPEGPVLAENLMQEAQMNAGFGYQAVTENTHPVQYVNLGYLAGGIASLQEFAQQPQAASHYGLNSTPAQKLPWEKPALQGVSKLENFFLMILLTDSFDTARSWIEQVQPVLSRGQVPMLLVTSAQISPLLQPYIESHQVKGLVAGIYGGMAYDQLGQVQRNGTAYWNSYQTGLVLAVLLIFVGFLVSGIQLLLKRGKVQGEG